MNTQAPARRIAQTMDDIELMLKLNSIAAQDHAATIDLLSKTTNAPFYIHVYENFMNN